MSGFIEGDNRQQATLFPERLDDYITEENPVRVVNVFIDSLDLTGLGFKTQAEKTGRPGFHPSTMLKLYVYGYLNRVQSSRRLEREAQRNVELMWLIGRLAPDFKTDTLKMQVIVRKSAENIPINILSDLLKRLERWGLLYREAYQNKPVRYAYRLTSEGKSLEPVLLEIMAWGHNRLDGGRYYPATGKQSHGGKSS